MLSDVIQGFILSWFFAFAFIVLVVTPFYLFGPAFETRYWPVISDAQVYLLSSDEEQTYYSIRFNKHRECTPVKETFAWYVMEYDGTQVRVNIDADKFLNIPFGLSRIELVGVNNVSYLFKSQKLVLTHRCHPLWITKTVINIPESGR